METKSAIQSYTVAAKRHDNEHNLEITCRMLILAYVKDYQDAVGVWKWHWELWFDSFELNAE